MTKKEFLERFDSLILELTTEKYESFTCNMVYFYLGELPEKYYHELVEPFLGNRWSTFSNIFFNETTTKDCLREFLIHQFKDECLRSKIYRRF